MEHLAPLGGVYQAGTLSGNPLAMAAGQATLDLLDQRAYQRLEATVALFAEELRGALAHTGLEATIPRVGSLMGFFLDRETPIDFDESMAVADNGLYPKLFHALLERGIAFAPGPYEILFPSLAHTDEVIQATVESVVTAAEMVVGSS